MKTIKAAVATVPRKSSMGPPVGDGRCVRQKMFNIIFCVPLSLDVSRWRTTCPIRPSTSRTHASASSKAPDGCSTARASPRSRSARSWRMPGYSWRLLSAFQRQERALCRSRAVVPVRGGAQALATAAPQLRQVARPENRRRLLFARPFRRPRELLPADRAALGRVAQQRCREGRLSGRSGEAAWSPAGRPRRTDARERALSLVALCVGGMVVARSVEDPALAHDLRRAAYRRAQTVLKADPC